MPLPKSYLTTVKNLEGILNAMTTGQAPAKFTQSFLEGLGFKGNSDRLIIGVLKELGFLTPSGEPTDRYFEFLDQSRSGEVLAEAIEEAYRDLYQLNRRAHEMPRAELKNKMKTLTRGEYTDSVLTKMATTFTALAKQADFEALGKRARSEPASAVVEESANGGDPGRGGAEEQAPRPPGLGVPTLGGLVYNIQIHLPESRDQAVYDALFRSLKQHLFE